MMTSSLLLNDVAEPETYEQKTSKNPVSSTVLEIVNSAKSVESALFEILKWPLIVDVESSIVRKNACTSIGPSDKSSILISFARVKSELLNLRYPAPGSACVVSLLNV